MLQNKSNFPKCSKAIGKILKRASVRFRFLQWPFEMFEKFEFFLHILFCLGGRTRDGGSKPASQQASQSVSKPAS
jgi:hypothetical protein